MKAIPEGRSSAGVFVSSEGVVYFLGGEDSLKNQVASSYKFDVDAGK